MWGPYKIAKSGAGTYKTTVIKKTILLSKPFWDSIIFGFMDFIIFFWILVDFIVFFGFIIFFQTKNLVFDHEILKDIKIIQSVRSHYGIG